MELIWGSCLKKASLGTNYFWIPLKPPGGGAPPPTHSWRICDRGLILAGVLGVLGNLGILGKNLENIAPERSQIEPRGLKNRAPGPPKSSLEPSKTQFFEDL